MTAVLKVGCCGFPVSREKYFKTHSVVEIQQTFYKVPSEKTLAKWRDKAPANFEYTIKAWQAITHPPSSPTWRKAGIKISKGLEKKYGYLKPTKENFEAWELVEKAAKILNAKVVIVQTPPSFSYNDENYRNALTFFSEVSRGTKLSIAWEPRGTWLHSLEKVKEIVERAGIIHCVDPFITDPVSIRNIVYLRLHGKNRKWPNYRYKYTDNDLNILKGKVQRYVSAGAKKIYVMFNNVYMYQDSLRFKELMAAQGEAIENK